MAGLSNVFQTSSDVSTTLPSWYDTAQQNLTQQALAATAPQTSQTAAQTAVNMLSPNSTTNPFTMGQGILQSIGTGAANPWMTTTDANGNPQVVGNPNTAMGGLFNAQTGYLNQIMPNVTATPEAQNIASGNFGSLRGETAVNKAKADALANLFQQQNTAALQSLATGVQAGTGLGTSGGQETQAALNTGTFQQQSPTVGLIGQSNIVNNLKPGTDVLTTANPSPLQALTATGTALMGGISGTNDILKTLGVTGGLSGLFANSGTPGQTTTTPETAAQTAINNAANAGVDTSQSTTSGTTPGGSSYSYSGLTDAFGNPIQ
jgi:hypothetical protein